jgi:hypothetical protein
VCRKGPRNGKEAGKECFVWERTKERGKEAGKLRMQEIKERKGRQERNDVHRKG